jgi:hypothetical protein
MDGQPEAGCLSGGQPRRWRAFSWVLGEAPVAVGNADEMARKSAKTGERGTERQARCALAEDR